MQESEDSDTLLQVMFLLFKLHNQGQLLVDAARSAYIVTHESTEHCKQRVIRMTTFEDETKIMLRLLQQNTKEYEDDIVTELRNSAQSCMLAGNEAQSATFMQNILFTSGMFIIHSVTDTKSLFIPHAGYFSIALEYVLKSCVSTDGNNQVLSAAAYLLMTVARGNPQVHCY